MKENKDCKTKKFINVSIIGISVLLSVLIILLGTMVIILLFQSSIFTNNHQVEGNFEDYQYLQYNQEAKRSSHGIVTLNEELFKDKDFISYEDQDELFLISEIGSYEFLCTGSCYCRTSPNEGVEKEFDENGRRIWYPFMFLLGGLAIVVPSLYYIYTLAMRQIAEDELKMKCREKFRGECKEEDVSGELDDCERIPNEDEDAFNLEESGEPLSQHDEQQIQDEKEQGVLQPEYFEDSNVDSIAPSSHHFLCKGTCKGKTTSTTSSSSVFSSGNGLWPYERRSCDQEESIGMIDVMTSQTLKEEVYRENVHSNFCSLVGCTGGESLDENIVCVVA